MGSMEEREVLGWVMVRYGFLKEEEGLSKQVWGSLGG